MKLHAFNRGVQFPPNVTVPWKMDSRAKAALRVGFYWPTYLKHHFLIIFGVVISKCDF